MAKPSAQKLKIHLNLLHPQGMPEKIPARFLKWLLRYGRFIVVFVEILVLGTFAARFKLDSDLANLKEKINNQVPVIESLASTENLINQTQFKIDTFRKVRLLQQSYPDLLSQVSSLTPKSVRLSSINLDSSQKTSVQIKIAGSSPLPGDISFYISSLRTNSSFKDLGLATVTLGENGKIDFTITGTIK